MKLVCKLFLASSVFLGTLSGIALAEDQNLEIICADKNIKRAPYLSFVFKITADSETPLLSPGLFEKTNRTFKISALTQSSYGTGMVSKIDLKGCDSNDKSAFAKIEEDTILFSCTGDGEGGEAKLSLISQVGLAYGDLTFPAEAEVFKALGLEEPEDKIKIDLVCKLNM